jgi:hypothetical protein
VEDREHVADLAAAVPAVLLASKNAWPVLELPREQRAAPLELAQDVSLEPLVLTHELLLPALEAVVRRPPVPAHQPAEERQRLDRPDEGVPLDQLPLVPEEAFELRRVEGAEPCLEHEMLRRRHGRDRVELEEAEPADGLEHTARRAVEQLCADGDPAGLVKGDGASHRARNPADRSAMMRPWTHAKRCSDG